MFKAMIVPIVRVAAFAVAAVGLFVADIAKSTLQDAG
jgi:hypothetical protein